MSLLRALVTSVLAALIILPRASQAEENVSLDKYSCAQFLIDARNPADGRKLLKSLMMISWGVGYAAAFQKVPRADATAIRLIAATLGETCRKNPSEKATVAIADAIKRFTSSNQSEASKAIQPFPTGSSRWEQDGSIVDLIADGASRKFFYEKSHDGAAKRSSLFFSGQKEGNHYSGVAYASTANCKPRGFQVSGDVSADEKQVTLRGKRPILDSSCKVTSYSEEPLVLTFIPSEKN
jgi:hypothetical protein